MNPFHLSVSQRITRLWQSGDARVTLFSDAHGIVVQSGAHIKVTLHEHLMHITAFASSRPKVMNFGGITMVARRMTINGQEVVQELTPEEKKQRDKTHSMKWTLSGLKNVCITDIKFSGIGELDITDPNLLSSETLNINSSAVGTLIVPPHTVDRVVINHTGVGSVAFRNTKISDLDITNHGVGNVTGFVGLEKLEIENSGLGNVTGSKIKTAKLYKSNFSAGKIDIQEVEGTATATATRKRRRTDSPDGESKKKKAAPTSKSKPKPKPKPKAKDKDASVASEEAIAEELSQAYREREQEQHSKPVASTEQPSPLTPPVTRLLVSKRKESSGKRDYLVYDSISKFKSRGNGDILVTCYSNGKSWVCPNPHDKTRCNMLESQFKNKWYNKKDFIWITTKEYQDAEHWV